ncbi:hypothetical protein [Streptomyces sp. NBC_01565]|uniref:hypothetical protein n=1 Tax=Streptomyces sp. NBC_01565 TaxID=2975881 RepID=UPI002255F790|nr:hypothetical protein [Streptomyces sp. NBC_01565]MCX4547109.1 hypothetical protein [Streptomyces sp. NBC_01565]
MCDNFGIVENATITFTLTVNVSETAPCSLTNTVTLIEVGSGNANRAANDPTTVTGGECDADGGDGGSILPINLNGVLPIYNNITTNNNINSPHARNRSGQVFGLNAP